VDAHFAARQALAGAAAGLEALAAQFRGVQKRLLGRFKARAGRCRRRRRGGRGRRRCARALGTQARQSTASTRILPCISPFARPRPRPFQTDDQQQPTPLHSSARPPSPAQRTAGPTSGRQASLPVVARGKASPIRRAHTRPTAAVNAIMQSAQNTMRARARGVAARPLSSTLRATRQRIVCQASPGARRRRRARANMNDSRSLAIVP